MKTIKLSAVAIGMFLSLSICAQTGTTNVEIKAPTKKESVKLKKIESVNPKLTTEQKKATTPKSNLKKVDVADKKRHQEAKAKSKAKID